MGESRDPLYSRISSGYSIIGVGEGFGRVGMVIEDVGTGGLCRDVGVAKGDGI